MRCINPDCDNKNVKLIVTKSNRLCAIGIQSDSILMYYFCVLYAV